MQGSSSAVWNIFAFVLLFYGQKLCCLAQSHSLHQLCFQQQKAAVFTNKALHNMEEARK